MVDVTFLLTLALLVGLLFLWAFRALPGEGWQILASVPVFQSDSETWTGMNLTYYGLFMAGSVVLSVAVFFILMAAIRIPVLASLAVVLVTFVACVPASALAARIVERRRHTFTIGGASFLGSCIAPAVVWSVVWATMPELKGNISVIPSLAAMAIAYAFGEGTGRLACISFGCCYGKPMSDCPLLFRRILRGSFFVFRGKTKKIAYDGGLEGKEVAPIQAVTSVICVCTALTAMFLYLRGSYSAAFLFAMTMTQGWRAISELLRADYRGTGKISAYQIMALAILAYSACLFVLLPGGQIPPPELVRGIKALWDPVAIISLELSGLVIFLHVGRSKVTSATIFFHIMRDETLGLVRK
jgi:prolipoprotein diacylglyceryltransferase